MFALVVFVDFCGLIKTAMTTKTIKTFVFDNGFHFVADVVAPVRNGDVKAVITADFGVCPLSPSVVRRQQRLTLGRNHKVDYSIATVTAQSGLDLTPGLSAFKHRRTNPKSKNTPKCPGCPCHFYLFNPSWRNFTTAQNYLFIYDALMRSIMHRST